MAVSRGDKLLDQMPQIDSIAAKLGLGNTRIAGAKDT
jgi:hypothetical protein